MIFLLLTIPQNVLSDVNKTYIGNGQKFELLIFIMAIRVVGFSNGGYKIGKAFA